MDVKALGADFLSGGVLKWLCGGPGGAFSMSRRAWAQSLLTSCPGATTDCGTLCADLGTDRNNCGACDNCLAPRQTWDATLAAQKFLSCVYRIREKSVRQTTRLIELADSRGYPVTAPRSSEQRGGTVAFGVPHAYGVAQALLANDVIVG